MSTLTIDDLTFEIRRSARRKALEIIVDRGGELVIASPEALDNTAIRDFIREKRFWLYTKLAEKGTLWKTIQPKEFVSGAGFSYLGRSYRLLLMDGQDAPLKLEAGRFRLLRREAVRGREHFVYWYTAHALPWLRRRVPAWARRIGVEPAQVNVRDLGFRWGSCGKRGVNFHWAVILLPPSIVDYVIVHELVHLHEANHTPQFWLRVERALPDYQKRKVWLAEHGGSSAIL